MNIKITWKRVLAGVLLLGGFAIASSTTILQIDSLYNSTGGATIAVPSVGTALLSDTSTNTVTNKSLSGASNTFSAIPVSAIATGTGLSVQSGGTGLATITAHGVMIGEGTSAVAPTSAGTAFQVLVSGGASADPTFAAISLNQAAAVSGQLGVANGGTGDATLTANGMLYGNGTSAVGITAAGSQYQVFQAGASGVPTVGALQLGQAAAVTGTLPVGNGGTGQASLTSGSVLIGAGTSAVTLVAPGTSGNVLTSNGSTWSSTAPASVAPTLNGTQAAPLSVVAGTGIAISAPTYANIAHIKSNVAASTTTVTATPSITACTADGQTLVVESESGTALITLQDEASLAGSKLKMNGNWTSVVGASGTKATISFVCDGAGFWVETGRNN